MIYNKSNFRKQKDKKIMRKKHKQWIVVSIAVFGALTGGYATSQTNVNADTVNVGTVDTSANHSTNTSNTSITSSNASETSNTSTTSSNASEKSNTSTTSSNASETSNISTTSSNASETSNTATTSSNASETSNTATTSSNASETSNTSTTSSNVSATSVDSSDTTTTLLTIANNASAANVNLGASLVQTNSTDSTATNKSLINSIMSSAHSQLSVIYSMASNSSYLASNSVSTSLLSSMANIFEPFTENSSATIAQLQPALNAFVAMDSAYLTTNDDAYTSVAASISSKYGNFWYEASQAAGSTPVFKFINSYAIGNGQDSNNTATPTTALAIGRLLVIYGLSQMGESNYISNDINKASTAMSVVSSTAANSANQSAFYYADETANSLLANESVTNADVGYLNGQYQMDTSPFLYGYQYAGNVVNSINIIPFLTSFANNGNWDSANSMLSNVVANPSIFFNIANSDYVSAWTSVATRSMASVANSIAASTASVDLQGSVQTQHFSQLSSVNDDVHNKIQNLYLQYSNTSIGDSLSSLAKTFQWTSATDTLDIANPATPSSGAANLQSTFNSIANSVATTYALPDSATTQMFNSLVSSVVSGYTNVISNNSSKLSVVAGQNSTNNSIYVQMIQLADSYTQSNNAASSANSALSSQANSLGSSANSALNSLAQSASSTQTSLISQQSSQNSAILSSTIVSLQTSANSALAQLANTNSNDNSVAISAAQSVAIIQLNSAVNSQSVADSASAQVVINSLNASAQSAITSAKASGNSELASQLASAQSVSTSQIASATSSVAQLAASSASSALSSTIASLTASAASDKSSAVSSATNHVTTSQNTNTTNTNTALSSAQSSYATALSQANNSANNKINDLQSSLNQINTSSTSSTSNPASNSALEIGSGSAFLPANTFSVNVDEVLGFKAKNNVLTNAVVNLEVRDTMITLPIDKNKPVKILGAQGIGPSIDFDIEYNGIRGDVEVPKNQVNDFFVNRYYTKSDVKKLSNKKLVTIRTLKPIKYHNYLKFSKTGKNIRTGSEIKVKAIRDYNGMTRFVTTKSNQVITGNKLFVKVIK